MMKIMMTVASAALMMSSPVFADIMMLARNNACLGCHSVDQQIVGPAFKEIAKKYAGDKNAHAKLVAKVKIGSKGVWGRALMPPNPQLKTEDAEKIIAWVLSLK